jgi:hypothetical protein
LNKLGLLARRSSPDKKKRFFSLSVGIHQPSRHRSDGDWKSLAQKDPVGHGVVHLTQLFFPPLLLNGYIYLFSWDIDW